MQTDHLRGEKGQRQNQRCNVSQAHPWIIAYPMADCLNATPNCPFGLRGAPQAMEVGLMVAAGCWGTNLACAGKACNRCFTGIDIETGFRPARRSDLHCDDKF